MKCGELALVQLREDVFGESLPFDDGSQAGQKVKLEIGNLLLGDPQFDGYNLVGPTSNEQ